MKLYTKTGDDGSTGLFGGPRVGKDHPRVDAYGTVDELNAAIGVARTASGTAATGGSPYAARCEEILERLQSRLFDLGADLATPPGTEHEDKVRRFDEDDPAEVEAWIDEMDAANPTMTTFVLPGGTTLAAHLHMARTVCRRAERAIVSMARVEGVTPAALVYLNRLGDLLFAMARGANHAAGVPDVAWRKTT